MARPLRPAHRPAGGAGGERGPEAARLTAVLVGKEIGLAFGQ